MTRFRRWRVCAAALVLGLLPAVSAWSEAPAGPQLDGAALRAARHAAPGLEMRLLFEVHRGDDAPVPLTVWLGADYVDLMEGGRETLYDFRLRRRLVLDRAAGTIVNLSLYGDVAFRRFEMENRAMLAQAYRSTMRAPPPRALEPFWAESEIGLPSGAKARPAIERETLADGAVRFRADGQEVALFAPAREAVPAELRASFAHFLRIRVPVHPEILAAIALDGRLPQRLVYVTVAGDERKPAGLVLKRSGRLESDYPLPATMQPRPIAATGDDDASVLRSLLPVMLQAVAGRAGGGPRPLADYRRAIDAALQQRKSFQAALLLTEMTMQYGRAARDCTVGPGGVPCHSAQELNRRLAGDPRTAALYRAQGDEAKEPRAALKLWQGLERGDVSDGYVIDAFLANHWSRAGERDEAAAAFARSLEGNPYLGAVYRDLGDHFLRGGRTDLAWICYDLGRALPGRSADDALAAIDDIEHELAARYPDFF